MVRKSLPWGVAVMLETQFLCRQASSWVEAVAEEGMWEEGGE